MLSARDFFMIEIGKFEFIVRGFQSQSVIRRSESNHYAEK